MARKTNETAPKVTSVYLDFRSGAAITDMAAIVTSYKNAAAKMAEEKQEELAPMSDAKVYQLVTDIPGHGESVDMARITAVYEFDDAADKVDSGEDETDESKRRNMSAHKGDKDAFKIGESLDPETIEHFDDTADAAETLDGAPIVLAYDFMRQLVKFKPGTSADKYNPANVLSNPILTWPVPSTGTTKRPVQGNNPPDHYENTDPAGEKIKGSFYVDIFAGTKPGAMWKQIDLLLKDAGKSDATLTAAQKAGLTGLVKDKAVAEFLTAVVEHNDVNAVKKLRTWNNKRRTKIVGKIRDACGFIQQRAACEDVPNIRVYTRGSVHAASVLASPIEMEYRDPDTDQTYKPAPISVRVFNRYDVAKARATATLRGKPCTVGDIIATTKKEKKTSGPMGVANVPKVESTKDFVRFTTAAGDYVSDGTHGDAILAKCLDGTDQAKALIYSLHTLFDAIEPIVAKTSVQFANINADLAEVRQKAAEERKDKRHAARDAA